MVENVLSLFSGAGGAVEGFKQAGYNVVGAVDFNKDCVNTLEENHPDVKAIHEDLGETTPSEFENKYNITDIDVLVGGPPCQGFSIAGLRDEGDDRNTLVKDFIDYVEYYSPETVLIENVVGILSMNNGEVKDYIVDRLEKMGYNVDVNIHNAADYGVAQERKRVLFVASKNKNISIDPTVENYKTVEESIGGLPSLDVGEKSDKYPNHLCARHSDDMVQKMEKVDRGDSLYDGQAYKKLHPDKPSFTMTSNNKAPAIHYSEPRVITVREMASLQSFPKDYVFCGTKDPRYRQVGNAVPPKMIEEIAKQL